MKLSVQRMALFGIFAALMYISRQAFAALPNIHPVGMMVAVITVVYRRQALYPLYTFVLLEGLLGGFGTWWVPYLYIWTVLWGAVMLLPKHMKPEVAAIVYALVCAAHGFLFGVLYAPMQAILFGYDWQGMIAWIAAGFSYDILHGIGNLAMGMLIVPLTQLLTKLDKTLH